MWLRLFMALVLYSAAGLRVAEATDPERASRAVADSPVSPLQPVIDWFERAHREYQEVVIKELSVPTGRSPEMPPLSAEIARAGAPALLDRVRGWLGFGPADMPAKDVLSQGAGKSIPDADKAELEKRIANQIEARAEEKRRADEELRVADAARTAEQALQKEAEARLKAADAQAAVEQKGHEPVPAVSSAPAPVPPLAPAEQPAAVVIAEPAPTSPAAPSNPAEAPAHGNRVPRTGDKTTADGAAGHVAQAQDALPAHWNRIPRNPGAPGRADEAAQKLAGAASKAADEILGHKSVVEKKVAGEPARVKPRGCARAGRKVEPPAMYTVKKGDSLWAIARRHYARGMKYMRIVRANENSIRDPDLIHPCQKIYLPGRHAWLLLEQLRLEPT